ncbi:MAG: acetyl-CoA hydrolase/transferase family protein [Verrucomicrobia bacterium]|nr:acetyl-CoA hydrolase/transferase family protein [Verrucomicrobiota bacterium]
MTPLQPSDWPKFIRHGYRLYFGSHAACPQALIASFLSVAEQFHDLEVVHILTLGEAPWLEERYRPHLRLNSFFLGANSRGAANRGEADFTPCFLSEIPKLFRDGTVAIDTAFVMVTPPDQLGYCSLGVSVDIGLAAVRSARYVVAQVNPLLPRTQGECFLHVSEIDAFLEAPAALPEHALAEGDAAVAARIGHYCSLLVDDGACLQAGIGRIPDAVMRNLTGRNDLGIHTEVLGDGLAELIRRGNVNNSRKGVNRGKSVTSFLLGTRELYDFANGNPHLEMRPSEYTNDPLVIARNPRQIAINSAIEVDLTGQVVADSIGPRLYSGIGGQVDFIRGAGMSPGGRPIIALESTAKGGQLSRITANLAPGAGVVTSRGDVHYVVTEYGIATLRGRSVRERALELIQVAHPKFRDELLERARERNLVPRTLPAPPRPIPEFAQDGELDVERFSAQGATYYLRPLQPSDQRRLQEFFYRHDEATVRQRWRGAKRVLDTEQAYRLVGVDQTHDLALAVLTRQGPREVIQAVGRFYRDGDRAELNCVTDESLRRRGLGGRLCDRLIEIARARGLRTLEARIRPDHAPMRRLLEHRGFVAQPDAPPSADHAEILLRLDLTHGVR